MVGCTGGRAASGTQSASVIIESISCRSVSIATTEEEITITKNGRATAVLISYEEFESWKETLAILSDQEFVAEIQRGIAELKKGRGKILRARDLDRLFAEES